MRAPSLSLAATPSADQICGKGEATPATVGLQPDLHMRRSGFALTVAFLPTRDPGFPFAIANLSGCRSALAMVQVGPRVGRLPSGLAIAKQSLFTPAPAGREQLSEHRQAPCSDRNRGTMQVQSKIFDLNVHQILR